MHWNRRRLPDGSQGSQKTEVGSQKQAYRISSRRDGRPGRKNRCYLSKFRTSVKKNKFIETDPKNSGALKMQGFNR